MNRINADGQSKNIVFICVLHLRPSGFIWVHLTENFLIIQSVHGLLRPFALRLEILTECVLAHLELHGKPLSILPDRGKWFSLIDKISTESPLQPAWEKVRRNAGGLWRGQHHDRAL